MKKLLVLVLALMLCMGAAMAENLSEKEIKFAEFDFGMTFEQTRSLAWVESLHFEKTPRPTRMVGDALNELTQLAYDELGMATGFRAHIGQREVAGHRGNVDLYFVYPTGVTADSEAVFYAGVYQFYENARNVFQDLKGKLAGLYGTPWMEATDAEQIWGPMPFGESENDQWRIDEWNNFKTNYSPIEYVVWKSSANGAMLVLKSYRMYGDMDVAEVAYLWPEADQYFETMMNDAGMGSGNNNVQGL